ncbi:hypothetical protein LSAT2_006564, partial [Lamellibrachia satsuma]
RFSNVEKFLGDDFSRHDILVQPLRLSLAWTCFSMRDVTAQRCKESLLRDRKFAASSNLLLRNLPLVYKSAHDVIVCLEHRYVARTIDCLSKANNIRHKGKNTNLPSRLFEPIVEQRDDTARLFHREMKRRHLANILANRAVNSRSKLAGERPIWYQKRRWGETLTTCITSFCMHLFGVNRVRCIVHWCNKQIRG